MAERRTEDRQYAMTAFAKVKAEKHKKGNSTAPGSREHRVGRLRSLQLFRVDNYQVRRLDHWIPFGRTRHAWRQEILGA
jgi:hypothetical protein